MPRTSRISLRSSLVPCSRIARSPGHHMAISFIQLPSTVSGTTTRCAFFTFELIRTGNRSQPRIASRSLAADAGDGRVSLG